MKQMLTTFMLGAIFLSCGTSKPLVNDLATVNPIKTAINLSGVKDDKVNVVINPGRFKVETVTYRMPKVVQGTYSISDFGKYVDDLKALDYNGEELVVSRLDSNSWSIADAVNLDKIEYLVNDTFDQEVTGGVGNDVPFSPAGTNIEPNNYVLNLHGFIGYFDSLKDAQYTLDITAPASFIRSSALQNTTSTTSSDGQQITTSYFAPRYFDITDNPMMFGKLDVEEFFVGDIKIVLSVYSPNNVHSASSLKQTMFDMMTAQKAYLGEINSTRRYDIYIYLSDGKEGSAKGFGALEHHTSTVVVMPESFPKEALANSLTDIVAHEFFHIVTPLSVHSEDIHYFDYYKPSFSKHLWMYEGVTEYFAQHFQVYEELVDANSFYATMKQKIDISKTMNDTMSFTVMSENIINEPYKANYGNVYQKGALIGMCLDILLRKESDGNRSLLSLMKELSLKYGKNKPFDDDMLIQEITAMTYPSVGAFLNKHVQGEVPIDYENVLSMVGLKYGETEVDTNFIFAGGQNLIFSGAPDKGVFFTELALKNSFWRSQGIMANDVLKKVNGEDLTLEKAQQVIGSMVAWQPGQDVELELERDGKPLLIRTTLTKPTLSATGVIEDEKASENAKLLRRAWLKG